MNNFDNCDDLYFKILGEFFSSRFKKGDQFYTQSQVKDWSNMSKRSVEKVFARLKSERLIATDGKNGSSVTFDSNNPQHLSLIPIIRTNPQDKTFNSYHALGLLLELFIKIGISNADESQIEKFQNEIKTILEHLNNGQIPRSKMNDLAMNVAKAIDNKYIYKMARSFFDYHVRLDIDNYDLDTYKKVKNICKKFYKEVYRCLDEMEYKSISKIVRNTFEDIYAIPNTLVVSLNKISMDSNEELLYERLVDELLVSIIVEDLKPQALLQTEMELAKTKGVARNTVRRAYRALELLHIIKRKGSAGTILIADIHNEKNNIQVLKYIIRNKRSMKEAMEALRLITRELYRFVNFPINSSVIAEIESEYERQKELYVKYGFPFAVYDIFLAPMLTAFPAGFIYDNFVHINEIIGKYKALFSVSLSMQNAISENVNDYIELAIDAIKKSDQKKAIDNIEKAHLKNMERLNTLKMSSSSSA